MREFDLLEHVYAASSRLGHRVRLGPGDDMAQVELDGRQLLAAVDQLVAGRHVNLSTTSLDLVGRKAITRSLSDIAAMGGRPVASLVAVTLPPDFGEASATALFDAMRVTAESYGCPLIGGDIAIHEQASFPLVCSVTVLAEPTGDRAITRGGARVGDHVCITGRLGGSVLPDGTGRHLTFEPRLEEARQLVGLLGTDLHAMIDISDGLGRDAAHIAEQSGVRIRIDAEKIPCTPGLEWRQAVSDGEDYELCFTASGDVPSRLGDTVVTVIGEVCDRDANEQGGGGGVLFCDRGATLQGDQLGWQHES